MIARYASTAARAGLALALFWKLTPREVCDIIQDRAAEIAAQNDADNQRAAGLMAVYANCHRGKRQRPYRPADFLPRRPQTDEEIIAELTKLT